MMSYTGTANMHPGLRTPYPKLRVPIIGCSCMKDLAAVEEAARWVLRCTTEIMEGLAVGMPHE